MKSFNKKIINELGLLDKFSDSEFEKSYYSDTNYSKWHYNRYESVSSLRKSYVNILGFPKDAIESFNTGAIQVFASDLQLSDEKRRELKELRSCPEMKMILGTVALQQKDELESTLGIKINNSGITIAPEYDPNDPSGSVPRQTFKSEKVLAKELDENLTTLSSALSSGQITSAQYDKYNDALGYIYDYYESQSRGEQVDFRKIADAEYEKFEEQEEVSGIPVEAQIKNENILLKTEVVESQQVANLMQEGDSQ